jgi:hypothetical protein
MAYNSYIVHGNDDGVIGVYSSWAKATECAMEYCGENAVEDTTDYSRGAYETDRNWDVRNFDGDLTGANITRWVVR